MNPKQKSINFALNKLFFLLSSRHLFKCWSMKSFFTNFNCFVYQFKTGIKYCNIAYIVSFYSIWFYSNYTNQRVQGIQKIGRAVTHGVQCFCGQFWKTHSHNKIKMKKYKILKYLIIKYLCCCSKDCGRYDVSYLPWHWPAGEQLLAEPHW